jgi:hypothetical protein
MSVPIGTRVAAVQYCNKDKTEVGFIGYGVYAGDFPIPDKYACLSDNSKGNHPLITLDDGTVVWGFECWWGEQEFFNERFKLKDPATKIIPVDIVRARVEAMLRHSKADGKNANVFKGRINKELKSRLVDSHERTGLMAYARKAATVFKTASVKFNI